MNHRKPAYTTALYNHKSSRPLRPGADSYRLIPSVISSPQSNETAKLDKQRYSGSELLGIATMHKSNAVPVTRGSEMAIATAKMRRG